MELERVAEHLTYNPATGEFHRIKRLCRSVAGSIDTWGYIQIHVCGRRVAAHRLAFLFMEGEFPHNEVDHINRIKTDNRWSNLRHATRSQNENYKPRRELTGVYRNSNGKRWKAYLSGEYLGTFDTPGQAISARESAMNANVF